MASTVGRAATFGFGLIIAFLLGNAVISYLNLRTLEDNEKRVALARHVLNHQELLLSALKDAETGQRGYLITGNEEYLKPYQTARGKVGTQLHELREAMHDASYPRGDLASLEERITAKLAELEDTIDVRRKEGFLAAQRIVQSDRGKQIMDEIRERIGRMERPEENSLELRRAESKESHGRALLASTLATGAGVVLVGLAYYWLARSLTVRAATERSLQEQRQWLHGTLTSIGDAVIATDTEGRITFANAVAATLTGWPAEEILGQPLSQVFHIVNEQTRKLVEDPAKTALQRGVIVGLANHTVLISRTGGETPIDDSAAPIRDAAGEMIGVVLVFRDVRERRAAEENRARLAAIVESSTDAIIGKDLSGTITSWNPGAQRLYGYAAGETIGQSIALLYPSDHPDELPGIMERLRRGERVDAFETTRRRKNGTLVSVSVAISPLRDDSGRLVGAASVARDISERKRLEAALRETDRRKDEFLATLGHELRNPLAPIRNALQIIRQLGHERNSTARQAVDMMERQVRQLVRLIDDLLDLGRISHGKVDLRRENIEIATIVARGIETAQPLIDARRHQLLVSVTPGLWLHADPVRLAQVVGNLLHNAAKFTAEGGQIRLTAEREGGDVVLRVHDNGVGIAPDQLRRVFDLFAQAGNTLDGGQGGLGIGLTLVKNLVELHGGRVEASSDGPGKGCEFTVRMPLLHEAPGPPVTRTSTPEHAARGKRVLIVDDNADAAESLGVLLRLAGHEVRTAYDGPSALSRVHDFHPDLAFLDIGLPGMSGYDLAQKLRTLPGFESTVLVALTGYGQDGDRRRAVEAGFHSHMVKPVDASELQELLSGSHPIAH